MLSYSEYSVSLLGLKKINFRLSMEFSRCFKDIPFTMVFLKLSPPDSLFIIYSNNSCNQIQDFSSQNRLTIFLQNLWGSSNIYGKNISN